MAWSVMRATTAFLVWAGACLGNSALVASGKLRRTPYVQLSTPDSIRVVWRTEGPIRPVVRFGSSWRALDRAAAGEAITARVALGTNRNQRLPDGTALWAPAHLRLPRLHSAAPGTFQYEAQLTDLQSDTVYYYAVYDGDALLAGEEEAFRFRTHPQPGVGRSLRFWVAGDTGTGRTAQAEVYEAMLRWVRQENRPLDFYLHVGDMAYDKGRDIEFQSHFFRVYEATLRNTVCWPAMGNHEGMTSKGASGIGPYYDAYVLPTRGEAGGLASGTEAYYSFDYANVHFVCLDSHDLDRSPAGAMARWLKMDLERTRADWLVAFWHHPPYSKGTHDSDKEQQLIEMRLHFMPILEAGGVDLVLTGHSHIYERSMLMDGAYATPTTSAYVILDDRDGNPEGDGPYRKSAGLNPHEGAVQVVAGHGGANLGRKGTMPVMRTIILEHGSVLVDIERNTLTALMINNYGHPRDLFRIEKGGRVAPTRLADPWQPPPWAPPAAAGQAEEVQVPPPDAVEIIPRHAAWQYVAGVHPVGTVWMQPGFPAVGWKTGQAGFGYGDEDDRTVLDDMRGRYSVVYIRHKFELDRPEEISELGLMINYDDAFIAYLNGHEVLRQGVGSGRGTEARSIRSHDAGLFAYFRIKDFEKHLRRGPNVLAIEGYNRDLRSSDFTLDPYLLAEM